MCENQKEQVYKPVVIETNTVWTRSDRPKDNGWISRVKRKENKKIDGIIIKVISENSLI